MTILAFRTLVAQSRQTLGPLPRAIFYDWDGTLLSFRNNQFMDSLNHVLTHYGHRPLASLSESPSIRATLGRIKTSNPQEVWDRFHEHFSTHPLSNSDLMPGVEPLLQWARDHSITQGVVSNLDQRLLTDDITRTGLDRYFAVALGSRNDSHLKPRPTLLMEAMWHTDLPINRSVPRHNIYYVGDGKGDIECAKGAGCWATLVNPALRNVGEDAAFPDLQAFHDMLQSRMMQPLCRGA